MNTSHITPSTTPTGEERVDAVAEFPLCGHTESITELYDVSDALAWVSMMYLIHAGRYSRCCD